MTDLEVVARGLVGGERSVERLRCHPRLSLVACSDSERPAVHIWDCGAGQLRELGSVGLTSNAYGDTLGWERAGRTPAVAWHPDQALLVVAGEDGLRQWTPAGVCEPEGALATASYRSLAFSPDGQSLWGSPSFRDEGGGWESSDVIDLATGTIGAGPRWDTGVAEHPGGGLVATLASDQGATYCLFARVGQGTEPAVMRPLRRALILDCDGYETPLFSADGRHLAVRGNAYDNSVEVFEFPSLHRVWATTLGDPSPGYPYPQEWLDQMEAWSRHNIAFASRPGVLWIATPAGALVEVDLETRQAVEHDVLTGSRLSALAVTATGELLVAGSGGDLVLLSAACGATHTGTTSRDIFRAAAKAFLEATEEVPDDGDDLEMHLVLTDGTRTWEAGDLATVTEASATDPTWLQLQAAINNAQVHSE
ncbi:WD40 repeat domain-containing protein [Streptomyces sp. NPDC056468]|uniref:WD40 repeat domain-containing protein n=1 Tax=Streptomyces sp. NPDC056468 TaxID=3345830 RepID=UPI003677AE31